MSRHVVIDGRVFSTEAADRGMGRFVDHVASVFVAAGHRVTLLVGRDPRYRTRALMTERLPDCGEPLAQSAALNRLLERIGADVYVDGTPFLWPLRLDLSACPVLAVLYDFIPMRFPRDYFAPGDRQARDGYANGLARVLKADHVIAISNVVKEHALRYLGIPGARVDVVPPGVDPVYESDCARQAHECPGDGDTNGSIVCIQGAHRSKNFPVALRFLETLSEATGVIVDLIVPTRSQRTLIDGVRQEGVGRLRIHESISEEAKLALQRRARVIAHLSLEEGYGIPFVEALALHRPIVCIDNAINRELLCGVDAEQAGLLLLDDPSLQSARDLDAAVHFVESASTLRFSEVRATVCVALSEARERGRRDLVQAVTAADNAFQGWHARAGIAVVAPTDFGSCPVSDYCGVLMRDGAPRYALLLGPAPRSLQLLSNLRLLPFEVVDQVRRRIPALLFNLYSAPSFARTFDEIAQRSRPSDVLVVHASGSYLPRWIREARDRGERGPELERVLKYESDDMRTLIDTWLAEVGRDWADADVMLRVIDRRFRSEWLRGFRGALVGHDAVFATSGRAQFSVRETLAEDSVILQRTRYLPMPSDALRSSGIAELGDSLRISLGFTRSDLVVGAPGSACGKAQLVALARVIARLDANFSFAGRLGGAALVVAGALQDEVLAPARAELESRASKARIICAHGPDEMHENAMLAASDVVVVLCDAGPSLDRECARVLALGRPLIMNGAAVSAEGSAAIVCRDQTLEDDLYARLDEFVRSTDLRHREVARSLAHYVNRHSVDRFFERLRKLNVDAAAV